MSRVFADTSFFVALLNSKDRHNARARELAAAYENFVTTDYVLFELGNAFSRAGERGLFLSMHARLSSSSQAVIVEASRGLTQSGIELFRRRADKDWSLTDCVSFVVMEREGLRDALTTDRHFDQAGFNVLMNL